MRILFVDDQEEIRALGDAILSPLGYEVVFASNGEQAIQLADQDAFDLVLMDVQMPGIDGASATRAIRAKETRARLPILALSANAMKHQVEACLQAGMDGHVSKPFTKKALVEAVAAWAPLNTVAGIDKKLPLPEIGTLRKQLAFRMSEDAAEIAKHLDGHSTEYESRVHAIIHRLAGTAGSLGFHQVGDLAIRLDTRIFLGETLDRPDLAELQLALQQAWKEA